MLGTSAEFVVCPGGIQLSTVNTIITPSATPTIAIGGLLSLNSFSLTMSANITAFTITGGITGYSQYIVYITGNATVAYTVTNNLRSTVKNKLDITYNNYR